MATNGTLSSTSSAAPSSGQPSAPTSREQLAGTIPARLSGRRSLAFTLLLAIWTTFLYLLAFSDGCGSDDTVSSNGNTPEDTEPVILSDIHPPGTATMARAGGTLVATDTPSLQNIVNGGERDLAAGLEDAGPSPQEEGRRWDRQCTACFVSESMGHSQDLV